MHFALLKFRVKVFIRCSGRGRVSMLFHGEFMEEYYAKFQFIPAKIPFNITVATKHVLYVAIVFYVRSRRI
ncbi:hypothetical protein GCM10011274_31520 [Paraglaciecola chathamensis]|jgi:hypothetical protein|uniref:Uncharacterized protein n=1 Tax=Paraglaciecola chathamensis TaxID=368405 RepID=A0A8H9M5C5_9ALTE|nr:hypothetical protein GCM10011274_31520 [Paraglaciecola oceanifecundans]